MLVLALLSGERVRLRIGDKTVWVRVNSVHNGRVRLGFEMPAECLAVREEVLERVKEGMERSNGNGATTR